MTTDQKVNKLDTLLREMGSLVIAFSGGVDSTYLLHKVAVTSGIKYTAITIRTPYMPAREIDEASEFCRVNNIAHSVVDVPFPDIIRENPPDRCYLCKKQLFGFIRKYADDNGFRFIADGTNHDDNGEYRPGLRALAEMGIRSPLLEAGLGKQEIRDESKRMNLPTWNKPAYACLLTRMPHNIHVKESDLRMIEEAEQYLFEKGFFGSRVRKHEETARIECMPGYFGRFVTEPERDQIINHFKKIGFRFISLDLEGYRTGSFNNNMK
ncbi:MAG: ATP-dependent sacrificial sulfur transferase LarE [Bacteroidales bacterium]